MLSTKMAVHTLVDAGVFRSRIEANRGVFDTLAKAKDLEKVEPGLYRLRRGTAARTVRRCEAITEREVWIRLLHVQLDEARRDRRDERIQVLETLLQQDEPDARSTLNPAVQSVRAMLGQLAQAGGGLLRAKDAVHALVDAGVFGSRVEANNVVFLTLTRAKDFEKVGSGVWRYVGPDPREERA